MKDGWMDADTQSQKYWMAHARQRLRLQDQNERPGSSGSVLLRMDAAFVWITTTLVNRSAHANSVKYMLKDAVRTWSPGLSLIIVFL